MPRLCLPKQARDRLFKALKSEDVSIAKLYDMSDVQRRIIFKQYVGKDFARLVNARFELAMASNQRTAFRNFINAIAKKDPIRRDMLKKVERVKKFLSKDEEAGFLKDLAEMKLGIGVTEKEAKIVLKLKVDIDKAKGRWSPTRAAKELEINPTSKTAGWKSETDRLAYGLSLDDFKQYIGNLKLEAERLPFIAYFRPKNYGKLLYNAAATAKSLLATLDNSFIGRQGIKMLLRGSYKIWASTFLKSFKLFGKELVAKNPGFFKSRSDAVMRTLRADIFSRPNAMNGKYTAAKNGYGLGVLFEEAFPSSFPEKIPLLGRLFKASETAFGGSALKMRADFADIMIANMERNGIDMLDEVQATAFGKLVTAMTGRGELGRAGAIGKELNVALFSIRFLKSNFDTVTAHLLDRTMTVAAKKEAVKSTLRIAASITGFLSIAKMLNPDSVDFDPRGTHFGQVKVAGHWIDVTGGMRGLVTLGTRVIPSYHNGEWGFWRKSATTGKFTRGAEFGEQTALDTFEQFLEGKFSPALSVIRDVWRGQNFDGEKPGFLNTTIGLITPISADMLIEELQKGNDDIVFAMFAEALGFSATDATFRGFGKKWQELKEKKGNKIYNEALKQVTENFNKKADKLQSSAKWERMDNTEQAKALAKIRTEENNRIFKRYGIK